MEFLFDLLLTAFFSLLFAFLLSKLFSSSSTSASVSASSHGAADVISGEAHSTGEGEELQEEKIIEVDNVVQKEVERGFLVEEGRSEVGESGATCEGTEGKGDGFLSHVGFDKEKVDHRLVQKDESVELETSIDSDKEKESCGNEVDDDKEDQSSVLIYVQDESYFRKEESSGEVKFNEPEGTKDGRDDLYKVEGSLDKMSQEVGFSTEEGSCLKEEHGFKTDSQVSAIVQEEVSSEAVVSIEFEKVKDVEHNFSEVEGPVSKTATEVDIHLKYLTMPEEEISDLATESSELKKEVEGIEFSDQKKEEEQEREINIFKAEGPTSKMTQFVGVEEKEKEEAFIEEEEWVWEGIERTDVEKQFGAAARFAASASGTDALSKLSNEVQLQLYGLHKIVTDGPCHESHRLALRPSTRAKWHAWQKLGNMIPEAAMEEYVTLLSSNVPNWSEQPIVEIEHKKSDELTVESGCSIEGPVAFGSASPEKGTDSQASIQ